MHICDYTSHIDAIPVLNICSTVWWHGRGQIRIIQHWHRPGKLHENAQNESASYSVGWIMLTNLEIVWWMVEVEMVILGGWLHRYLRFQWAVLEVRFHKIVWPIALPCIRRAAGWRESRLGWREAWRIRWWRGSKNKALHVLLTVAIVGASVESEIHNDFLTPCTILTHYATHK